MEDFTGPLPVKYILFQVKGNQELVQLRPALEAQIENN